MSQQSFRLSGVERMLLAIYNTVPVQARAEIGQRLFNAWTREAHEDAIEIEARRVAAFKRFRIGTLNLSVMDDLQQGERAEGKQTTTAEAR